MKQEKENSMVTAVRAERAERVVNSLKNQPPLPLLAFLKA